MDSKKYTDEYGYYWDYLNNIFEEYGRKHGLNYTQLSVLYAVYRFPGCTQKRICEMSFLPKQTINTAVMHYVREGLIEQKADEADHRVKKLYFTEKRN